MLQLPLRGFNLSLFCSRELRTAQKQLAEKDLACTIKLEYVRQKSQLHAAHFQFTPLNSVRSASVLPDIDSKSGGTGWFGSEEENVLIQGVLNVTEVCCQWGMRGRSYQWGRSKVRR
jgi:hypothetical protein